MIYGDHMLIDSHIMILCGFKSFTLISIFASQGFLIRTAPNKPLAYRYTRLAFLIAKKLASGMLILCQT